MKLRPNMTTLISLIIILLYLQRSFKRTRKKRFKAQIRHNNFGEKNINIEFRL